VNQQHNFLIVGAGFYGSVMARELANAGYKVKVIDKRDHIGGNAYTKNIDDIDVHVYGAHIFHTNDKGIWDYINQFGEFNNFKNSPVAYSHGKMYSLPFNMWTFNQLWGVTTPDQAKAKIEEQKFKGEVTNLEEQALSMVGTDIYRKLIKGYTTKQWGKDPKELPASIIKRLPVRFTWDNNYFNDKYQGIPVEGYTRLFNRILDHPNINVELNFDYFEDRDYSNSRAEKIIYTGPIDRFFDYKHGKLEYRSLKFVYKTLDNIDFQGNAVVNYSDVDAEFTRIIEHKHFNNHGQRNTVITYEFPQKYTGYNEPYYPVNDDKNNDIYNLYKKEANQLYNVYFGGRLAEYRYYDMHQVIASALKDAKKIK
jgi:UDP-galactopyranose mutase